MAAFMPEQSPPLVSTAIRFITAPVVSRWLPLQEVVSLTKPMSTPGRFVIFIKLLLFFRRQDTFK
jgi:hypothetical protein